MTKIYGGFIAVLVTLIFTGASCSLVPVQEKKQEAEQKQISGTMPQRIEVLEELVVSNSEGKQKYIHHLTGLTTVVPTEWKLWPGMSTESMPEAGFSVDDPLNGFYEMNEGEGIYPDQANFFLFTPTRSNPSYAMYSDMASGKYTKEPLPKDDENDSGEKMMGVPYVEPTLVFEEQVTTPHGTGHIYVYRYGKRSEAPSQLGGYDTVTIAVRRADSTLIVASGLIGLGDSNALHRAKLQEAFDSVEFRTFSKNDLIEYTYRDREYIRNRNANITVEKQRDWQFENPVYSNDEQMVALQATKPETRYGGAVDSAAVMNIAVYPKNSENAIVLLSALQTSIEENQKKTTVFGTGTKSGDEIVTEEFGVRKREYTTRVNENGTILVRIDIVEESSDGVNIIHSVLTKIQKENDSADTMNATSFPVPIQ